MIWVVYLLFDPNSIPFYVGTTVDLRRRLNEHKRRLGFKPRAVVLESGAGDRYAAEVAWIAEFTQRGMNLDNLMTGRGGGRMRHADKTRSEMSEKLRGRPKPAGHGAMMSRITKGKPHIWTNEGWERAARSQFRPGHQMDAAQRTSQMSHMREWWKAILPGDRSRRATGTNLKAWSRRSTERRSEIGQKIAAARAKNLTPEQISAIASANAKVAFKDPAAKERCSRQVRDWWASLAPDEKRDYVARRAAAIKRAREARKAQRDVGGRGAATDH